MKKIYLMILTIVVSLVFVSCDNGTTGMVAPTPEDTPHQAIDTPAQDVEDTPTEVTADTSAPETPQRKKITVSNQYCPNISGIIKDKALENIDESGFSIKICDDFQTYLDMESDYGLKIDTTGTWSWPGSIWSNPSLIFSDRSIIVLLKPAGEKTKYSLIKTEYDDGGIYFTVRSVGETDDTSVLQGLYVILDKKYTEMTIYIELE